MLNRIFSVLAISLVSYSITGGAYAAGSSVTPEFGSIVKKDATSEKYCSNFSDPSGICRMTQQNAVDYCASQQNHLPSAREMALLSTSLGAKGIVENCGNDGSCYHIKAENLDKTIDEFNFSFSGYNRPEGDLGDNWFWSSSVVPNGAGFGFVFGGYDGDVYGYDYRYYNGAVRCAVGR